MTIQISGTSGIVFPDSTSQTTKAIEVTGGRLQNSLVMTGLRSQPNFTNDRAPHPVEQGIGRVRQYSYNWNATTTSGSIDLIKNTGSYADIHCFCYVIAYHSGRSYQMWEGVWGGYGNQLTSIGGGGGFGISMVSNGAGFNTLRLSWSTTHVPWVKFGMLIFNNSPVQALVGNLVE
jgi:hypothetical protein